MNLQTQTTNDTSIEYEPSDEYDGDGTTLHLPSSTQPIESHYWGAITSTEVPGKNTHIIYPDYSSLYPNCIRTMNISPDTIVGTQDDLDASRYTEDDCIWSFVDSRSVKQCDDTEEWQNYRDPQQYKAVKKDESIKWKAEEAQYDRCYYLRPDIKEGFITELTEDFADKKDEHDGTHLYDSTKEIYNSVYGVLGFSTDNNAFRLFDVRNAESVSLIGRKVLRVAMNTIVEFAEREYGVDAYITHYDTDGCGVSLDVDGQEQALEIGHAATEYLRETAIPEFLIDNCGYTEDLLNHHTLEADIEYYAPSIYIHDSNKRYATLTHWDEGEDVDELSITGFEAVRSDVANVTIDVQETVFNFILRNNIHDVKQDVYEYVSGLMNDIENGDVPLEDLGTYGGIGQPLEEYGSANRRAQPIYRGALWARKYVPGEDGLGEGSKPQVFPVKYVTDDSVPHHYERGAQEGDAVDAVAVENPSAITDMVKVDRSEVATKQVADRVRPIFENVDELSWTEMQTGHVETSLDAYM